MVGENAHGGVYEGGVEFVLEGGSHHLDLEIYDPVLVLEGLTSPVTIECWIERVLARVRQRECESSWPFAFEPM